MKDTLESRAYNALTAQREDSYDADIPDSLQAAQPRNFFAHVIALSATKLGDGIADPKIVLPWLLTSLGAPAYFLGLLVPLREAGALLPQMFVAERIGQLSQRKWAWIIGAVVQGVCVSAMGIAALTLTAIHAALVIVALLSLFALSRSLCSVSYKDVLGRTLAKASRGTATGSAASIAAALLMIFSIALSVGWLPRTIENVAYCLCFAGCLWILAALSFARLREESSEAAQKKNLVAAFKTQFDFLLKDKQLMRFNLVRALLSATAMAPPFLLALAGRERVADTAGLGLMLLASSLASALSAYVWGRLSDQSSRKVLILSAMAGAVILLLSALTAMFMPALYRYQLSVPGMLFVLMIAYQGVRLGRSTHIVDMSSSETRAIYTALSNTLIGVVLLGGGAFGIIGQAYGPQTVLMIFAIMSAVAACLACGLQEVQNRDPAAQSSASA